MSPSLSGLLATGLDILFPRECLICRAPDTVLCERCRRALPQKSEQCCPLCARPTRSGEYCPDHASGHALVGIFACSPYRHPLVETILHTYKYRFLRNLSDPLGRTLAEALARFDLPLPDLILPVPLHKWRFRYRGFNQSELLAHILAQTLLPGTTLPVHNDILLRRRFTLPQQMVRSAEERRGNLKNAFIVTLAEKNHLKGKTVWLIDDVATTGTTLEECAAVLRKAGAKQVSGIVFAR